MVPVLQMLARCQLKSMEHAFPHSTNLLSITKRRRRRRNCINWRITDVASVCCNVLSLFSAENKVDKSLGSGLINILSSGVTFMWYTSYYQYDRMSRCMWLCEIHRCTMQIVYYILPKGLNSYTATSSSKQIIIMNKKICCNISLQRADNTQT